MSTEWFSDTPISKPLLAPSHELISFNGFAFAQTNGIILESAGLTDRISKFFRWDEDAVTLDPEPAGEGSNGSG